MQTNPNSSGGTQPSDLLSAVYHIEIRNEEKISAADRAFCERQQAALYETLELIERCYTVLCTEAGHYSDFFKITCEPNGRIAACARYPVGDGIPSDYRIAAFKLFDSIETFVKLNYEVNEIFVARIVRYFNDTYHVSVPKPTLDAKTLVMGFRPVYTTYVDRVIEHLGGRSFGVTAKAEILDRFLGQVRPVQWSESKPELKGCKIIFPYIVSYDNFYFKWHHCHHMSSSARSRLDTFCEGIMLGADGRLDGSRKSILGLNTDDVDLTRWYDTAVASGVQMLFFKNGRIDVKFRDAAAAESCFRRLRLHELRLPGDND